MKQYNVTFEVFSGSNHNEYKTTNFEAGTEYMTISVEAGTKKLAAIRAMILINKIEGYSGLYKNVLKVEEINE